MFLLQFFGILGEASMRLFAGALYVFEIIGTTKGEFGRLDPYVIFFTSITTTYYVTSSSVSGRWGNNLECGR